ncbi:MAG TPA: hypothetical protein VJ783_15410 [Pirellulales bacterium]|nr:hypothetical protein [Pirellulales bacterium]
MTGRFQFSLRRLFWWTTCAALLLGVLSWLAPETRFAFWMFALVFAYLFGMLFAGVLALAVVIFCCKLARRAITRMMIAVGKIAGHSP